MLVYSRQHVKIVRFAIEGVFASVAAMVDWDEVRAPLKRWAGDLIGRGMDGLFRLGAIGPDSARGRHFGKFGADSVICFPYTSLYGERWIWIGSGSWLGHGAIVLPGATIGSHVVVAAGSVVTGDLPDNCVAAGAPARVIRRHDRTEGWVTVA